MSYFKVASHIIYLLFVYIRYLFRKTRTLERHKIDSIDFLENNSNC